MKKILHYIVFSITFLLLIYCFYKTGMFQNYSLVSDAYAEYYPLLSKLLNILKNNSSLFYSFNITLGDPFYGTFIYYLLSPFNLLVLLIDNISFLIKIISILKLSLASVSCYLFLNYQFKEKKLEYLIPMSILYGVSSFALRYNLNIMWLDVYMLFPLILLGIDYIIDKKKPMLFIITLVLSVMSNYYFAFMICLFSFIYYNYKLLLTKNNFNLKEILKNNIYFIILGILCMLCAFVVLYPAFSELGIYSRENGLLFGGESLKITFNLKSFMNDFVFGNYESIDIMNEKNYHVYLSIIVLPLVVFFSINKTITKKERFLSLLFILLLLMSCYINFIGYTWSMFTKPNFFCGRFVFQFFPIILLICTKSLYNLSSIKYKWYVIIVLLVSALFYFSYIYNSNHTNELIRLLTFYVFILILLLEKKKHRLMYLILPLIIAESALITPRLLEQYSFDDEVYKLNKDTTYSQLINKIKDSDKTKFYRIENNELYMFNYSLLNNYNGVDAFLSTLKNKIVDFEISLGLFNTIYGRNVLLFDGSHFIPSSLLGIKYYIDDSGNFDNQEYDMQYMYNSMMLYENPYCLSLGYLVNSNTKNDITYNNSIEYLNKIMNNFYGENINVLKKVEINKLDENNYYFDNTLNHDYYIKIEFKKYRFKESINLKVNDIIIDNYNNDYYYHIKNDYKDIVKISLETNENNLKEITGVYVYYYDMDLFKTMINNLKENELILDIFSDTYIKGSINVKDNNILFTSIPYDDDWSVFVDNKKVEKIELLNTFIGIELTNGDHTIEYKYIPKKTIISLIVSFLGIIATIIYNKKQKIM